MQPSGEARCLIFGRTLCLLPYFICANSEGSGETAQMCKLAWTFAGRQCDKNHNLMSWLKYQRAQPCGLNSIFVVHYLDTIITTLQSLYTTVLYNTVLDITHFSVGRPTGQLRHLFSTHFTSYNTIWIANTVLGLHVLRWPNMTLHYLIMCIACYKEVLVYKAKSRCLGWSQCEHLMYVDKKEALYYRVGKIKFNMWSLCSFWNWT